jgi:hypothetical protein
MENNNHPPKDETASRPDSLLKQRINYFLINYFNHLAFAVSLIIFIAGIAWFVYPQYQNITKDEETASKYLQAQYAAKSNYLHAIGDLKKNYLQISQADRNKIEAMVPVETNVTAQIPKIESIILSNAAILNFLKIEPVDNPSQAAAAPDNGEKSASPAGIFYGPLPQGVKLVRIEIGLSSVNYQVLKNIIKAFENNLRLYDVAKIEYNVADNKAVLIIYSYYLSS